MTVFDDLPVPDGDDPIGSDDPIALRAEILRLRESLLATNGRTEVLRERITELEAAERALHAENAALHDELGKNPVLRFARAARRRLTSAS